MFLFIYLKKKKKNEWMLTRKEQMATTDICALEFNWIFTSII